MFESLTLISLRPKTKNTVWEDPPIEGAPFDYRELTCGISNDILELR